MRRFCHALLSATLMMSLAPAMAAEPPALFAQYDTDPCTDGRISDGRPRSCREIRRWLRERDDEDDWRPGKQWK